MSQGMETAPRRSFALALITVCALPILARAQAPLTADDVVNKHLAALGGRAALEKLTSRRATGTVTVGTAGGDIPGTIELALKMPNKARALLALDLRAFGGDHLTVGQRFDGTTGVAMNSQQGDQAITGNQLEDMRNATFPTPLLNYKAAGMKVELLPRETLDGAEVIVLLVTPKAGSAMTMYFDAKDFLLSRTVVRMSNPQLGGDVEQVVQFSDYRTVDGVRVPFHLVNSNPAQKVTISLTKVEHNVAIADSIFVK